MRASFLVPLIFLLMFSSRMQAQRQNNVWYFGNRAGVDFNGSAALPLSNSAMYAIEGCSVICDAKTGSLLFYTNGDTVWNRNHVPMPNGTGLFGHWSSTQGALIVPMPDDPQRYYIFTTDAIEDSCINGLSYSVVNMELDGGRGDVELKNVALLAPGTEKLCGIRRCDGKGYWVITHARDTNAFYAYGVTPGGIAPPVASYVGSSYDGAIRTFSTGDVRLAYGVFGDLAASPDGRRLAAAVPNWSYYYSRKLSTIELFDFDNETGQVSNVVVWPMEAPDVNPYGLCFSPDNTKLYAYSYGSQSIHNWTLYQYDLVSNDSAKISASATLIYGSANIGNRGSIELAPDGKIYLETEGSSWLSNVEKPNAKGLACSFQTLGFSLGKATGSLGLPNFIDYSQVSAGSNRSLCAGDTTRLHASGAVGYRWSPSDSLSCTDCSEPLAWPASTTTYHLMATEANGCITFDSVTISVYPSPQPDAGPGQSICVGENVQLSASGGVAYRWSPKQGLSCADCPDPVASPSATTHYSVLVTGSNGCTASDTVTVTVFDRPVADAGKDTAICIGGGVRLHATGGISWKWSPLDGLSCDTCSDPVATPSETTTYFVTATGIGGCTSTDSVTVRVNALPEVDAGTDVALCPGSVAQLHATGGTSYRWNSSPELSCLDCSDPVARPSRTTTYYVQATNASGCSAIDSVTVTVVEPGSIDAGPTVAICAGGSAQLHASDGSSWRWNPAAGLSCVDCRDPIASPTTTTRYTVDVGASGGCTAGDTVTVTVLPQPRADAGPDGSICPGGSVQLHSSGGATYQWSPATGLSCADCADPVASPAATTVYTVTAASASGCRDADEVTVSVGSAATVASHIDTTYRVFPGRSITVPVVLDGSLNGPIEQLQFNLVYNGGILRLQGVTTGGTQLDGWQGIVTVDTTGGIVVRYVAPPGGAFLAKGTLLNLTFLGYLGDTVSSALRYQVRLGDHPCEMVASSAGQVSIDSICGLSFRLIESGMGKYALQQSQPNPASGVATIEFSLGLDGTTRLDVLNSTGTVVAVLLNGYMQPGSYSIAWDATEESSGLYYYRLTSGSWSQTERLMLVK